MAQESSPVIEYTRSGDYEGLRLCLANFDADTTTAKGDTALHIVSKEGHEKCAKLLLAAGASVNVQNDSGYTPLHIATMANNHKITSMLLEAKANPNIANNEGDLPIHIASWEGYLEVVKQLCSHSTHLNTLNNLGFAPLHLACRNGHIEIVRCLCLSGCDIELKNSRGITADITALKLLHKETGILLNKLRSSQLREDLRKQFHPIEKYVPKQSVKILGYECVGKTTLVQSLSRGYLKSLFSRSKAQILGTLTGGFSAPTASVNRLETSFGQTKRECSDGEHTQGIKLHQAAVSSSDLTIWDFSGSESYHMIYDYFIGDPYSIYIIVFNLGDTIEVQYRQCSFWLRFLQQRLHESYVKNKIRPRLILVGTHADSSRMHKDKRGNYINPFAQEMREKLSAEFSEILFYNVAILCDSHTPNSPGLMDLKYAITARPSNSIESKYMIPTGFFLAMIPFVESLRKKEENFPVISWSEFVNKIHEKINVLAMPHHINQVVDQLQTIGKIYHLKSDAIDSIILDMNWFCNEIIGKLLSCKSLVRLRITGCFTEDEFQNYFDKSLADKTLPLLEALEICTKCKQDEQTYYEFPCFNSVKEEGLWSENGERYKFQDACYGGVRLKAPPLFLKMAFPRIQTHLRKMKNSINDPKHDLYQWMNGSKYSSGIVESLITLENENDIDIKVRGPRGQNMACFDLLKNLLGTVQRVLAKMVPNMVCEQHILSSEDLRHHSEQPFVYPPENIFMALSSPLRFNTMLRNQNNGREESLCELIGFASDEVCDCIRSSEELSIEQIPMLSVRKLSRLLESKDSCGSDWISLATKLGLGNRIDYINQKWKISRTHTLLDVWKNTKKATIGKLVKSLLEIGREDAVNEVTRSVAMH